MNAARIDRILDELGDIWRTNPDLRFGQLLVALAYPNERISFFEDDETLEARITAQARLLAARRVLEVDRDMSLDLGRSGEAPGSSEETPPASQWNGSDAALRATPIVRPSAVRRGEPFDTAT
jgi:hypothetical protein